MSYASTAGVGHGLERVTDNIARLPLPPPLPDLKTVNAYVVSAPDGVTLIDPGWAYRPGETALLDALAVLDRTLGDVRRILVTHQHWDHYSLAVKWRDAYGIELLLGYEERHSIEAFATLDGVHPRQVGMLIEAGAAELAGQVARLEWEPHEKGVAFTPPDRWLHDGEVIDCGPSHITVRATPGHTRGHVVFEDEAHGVMFTGDHLLPRITPSIAFERTPERLPLRSYLASLRLLLGLPDARMLPAHGTTEHTTRARTAELLDHHSTRLTQVADMVAAGNPTSFEVATKMRWTRRERRLDELEIVHRMMAVLEVQSHLDVLVSQRVLQSDVVDGVRQFSVA
ncbi:MBL fold metallo-hydrolase [Mycolicibacterium palauense]|uniref:MBL fold metallo-hydrolase n=1 Tax=Mycolicibacterium palauense TaxID=2034511 RepID=UPI000BFEDA35|nr:MBL fold metallo-hydrolase [Mycolicibacterium palauense]